MIGTITALIVIILAAALLLGRVPVIFALGLPALVATLLSGGPNALLSVSLSVITPFANYSFVGLLIWAAVAGILIESGLMEKYFTALYIVCGRQVTPARREAWRNSIQGLPMTTVALLVTTGTIVNADNHFLLFQMLLVLIPMALLAGSVTVFSAPKISQMTLKKMRSTDGESWKTTAKATAEVAQDGSTRRSTSRSQSLRQLVFPLAIIVAVFVLLFISPWGIVELGAAVWVAVLVVAVFHAPRPQWLQDAGVRGLLIVAYVASTVAGAWWLVGFLKVALPAPREFLAGGGSSMMILLAFTLVLSLVAGEIIGSEAGATLAVGVTAPFLLVAFDADAAMRAAATILTSLLTATAILGGILARILPPHDSPFPLTPTPITKV